MAWNIELLWTKCRTIWEVLGQQQAGKMLAWAASSSMGIRGAFFFGWVLTVTLSKFTFGFG